MTEYLNIFETSRRSHHYFQKHNDDNSVDRGQQHHITMNTFRLYLLVLAILSQIIQRCHSSSLEEGSCVNENVDADNINGATSTSITAERQSTKDRSVEEMEEEDDESYSEDEDDEEYDDEEEEYEDNDVYINVWGKPQLIRASKREQTLRVLEQSQEYMTNTVFADEDYESIRYDCRNLHANCSYWASRGDCEDNIDYSEYTTNQLFERTIPKSQLLLS